MGDQSMRDCIIEQLVILNASLPKNTKRGSRAMHWYDDGADVAQLQCVGSNVNGLRAWGYLEGVADVLDVTVQEMLDGQRLDWTGSTKFSRAKEHIKRVTATRSVAIGSFHAARCTSPLDDSHATCQQQCPKMSCRSMNVATHNGTSQCLACETAWLIANGELIQ